MSRATGRPISVRAATPDDADAWGRLRTALWPASPDDHPREIEAFFRQPPHRAACFVGVVEGAIAGFAEVGLREYAEACSSSPVAYLEGIYVESSARELGVGRALVVACEEWGRTMGCSEMASDREIANEASGAFHLAVGFEEAVRLVTYRKDL